LNRPGDTLFQEACAEERRILESESSEKESLKALLQCRAQKDLRHARLLNVRKRISKAFANFAHGLLAQKEREITALFNALLPSLSIAGLTNADLVRASAPVTRVRQVANWCNSAPKADQQEELAELKQLPRLWLAALRKLIVGEN
jgi:hypothetical protein